MDQFIVPQFIDVEDKILGPITTRQFVMMIVGGLFLVLAYNIFDISLFIFIFIIVAGLIALFGFYKVNGRPFHFFIVSFLQVGFKPRVRIWRKEDDAFPAYVGEETDDGKERRAPVKHASRAHLAELAPMVDKGGVYEGEALENPKPQYPITNKTPMPQ